MGSLIKLKNIHRVLQTASPAVMKILWGPQPALRQGARGWARPLHEGPAACVNANGWLVLENQIISIYACLMRISKAYNVANASRLRAGALGAGGRALSSCVSP